MIESIDFNLCARKRNEYFAYLFMKEFLQKGRLKWHQHETVFVICRRDLFGVIINWHTIYQLKIWPPDIQNDWAALIRKICFFLSKLCFLCVFVPYFYQIHFTRSTASNTFHSSFSLVIEFWEKDKIYFNLKLSTTHFTRCMFSLSFSKCRHVEQSI